MDTTSRPAGVSLSKMVHEITDFLQAHSDESTTQSSSGVLNTRMRTLLVSLLSECLEFRIGPRLSCYRDVINSLLTVSRSCRQRERASYRAKARDCRRPEVSVNGQRG